ncbi:MAG: hypothetical protein HZA90_03960 [Verrucomicrobia bacterium]|nr:hypothetical protein [Verrucomicrobiota bacterium]
MKLKEPETKTEAPFDPVLFATLVPSRKPTAKDRADAQEKPDDAIDPKEYRRMDDMVDDL